MLEIADAREILIEPTAIAGAEIPLQGGGLLSERVENAAPAVEVANLRLHLLGRALEKKLVEHVGCAALRRNRHARTGPRKTARAAVDRERERREARQRPNAFRDVLVKRDGVAKRAARWVRCRREKRDVGRVTA